MAGELGPLYGRGGAKDLVREFLARPEHDGALRSRQVPVLVFAANRGGGKTALLRELAKELNSQVPFAYIDCETTDATTVPRLLSALAFELNRQCGKYGRLAFPRFITGQLVSAQKLDLTNRTRAREVVRRTLEDYRKIDRLRAFLVGIAPKVISVAPVVDGIPGVSAAGKYLPDLVLSGLVSWRRGRRVVLGEGQYWYGHQDRGLDCDSIDVLVDLNRQVSNPDITADRREVNELLWAAFLADLRDDFRRGRRADEWSLNCAVLVDNADVTIGLNFLDELVSARLQHAAHAPDSFDPLTVVVTSRGVLSARVTEQGESVPVAENASYDDYLHRGEGRLDRWWYPVLLSDLNIVEVGNMVSGAGLHAGNTRLIRDAIYRFTSGHPGSTRVILNAISKRPSGATDLRALLECPAPGGVSGASVTVEQLLVSQFLPEFSDDAIGKLAACAAARDIVGATRLVEHSGLLADSPGEHSSVFKNELWTVSNGAEAAVLRPVLRRLMLRRLAARAAVEPANWSAVHGWLRRDCAVAGDDIGVLYHALALDDVEFVADHLAPLLPTTDGLAWLVRLKSATSAPNRLDPLPDPVVAVRRLTDWVNQRADQRDLPLRSLARLITALWIDTDPLGENRRDILYFEIAAGYDAIAPYSANGSALLRAEAEKYREKARRWA